MQGMPSNTENLG